VNVVYCRPMPGGGAGNFLSFVFDIGNWDAVNVTEKIHVIFVSGTCFRNLRPEWQVILLFSS